MLMRYGLSGLGDAATWLGPISFGITFTDTNTNVSSKQGGAPNVQLGDSYQVAVQAQHAGADVKLVIQDSGGNTISSAIVGQTDSTGKFTFAGQFNALGTFVYNFYVGNSVDGGWYVLTGALQLFPTVTATAPQSAFVQLTQPQMQVLSNAAPNPTVLPDCGTVSSAVQCRTADGSIGWGTLLPAAAAQQVVNVTPLAQPAPTNPVVTAPVNPTNPGPASATPTAAAISAATGLPSYWPYVLLGLGVLGMVMMEGAE